MSGDSITIEEGARLSAGPASTFQPPPASRATGANSEMPSFKPKYNQLLKPSTTLYLFFDESGNFDFSRNGTPYFAMVCLAARRPFEACHDLLDAKYDTFENGMRLKKFHATSDKDRTKSLVYSIIERHSKALAAYGVFFEKKRLPDSAKTPDGLYAHAFDWLTTRVVAGESKKDTDQIIAVTDDLPQEAKRRQVSRPLKKALAARAREHNLTARLEHFPSESDFNLQITDYLCWAFMRHESGAGDWPWMKVASIFKQAEHL